MTTYSIVNIFFRKYPAHSLYDWNGKTYRHIFHILGENPKYHTGRKYGRVLPITKQSYFTSSTLLQLTGVIPCVGYTCTPFLFLLAVTQHANLHALNHAHQVKSHTPARTHTETKSMYALTSCASLLTSLPGDGEMEHS